MDSELQPSLPWAPLGERVARRRRVRGVAGSRWKCYFATNPKARVDSLNNSKRLGCPKACGLALTAFDCRRFGFLPFSGERRLPPV